MAFGLVLAVGRLVHLTVRVPGVDWPTTEWLQRATIGVPYFIFRFFGLDMWGWVFGTGLFFLFATFGLLCFCCFNCFGRVRIVQSILRRRRDAMPFMDMVSNRFTLFSYNALLFVFPFCILSTLVIGGSVLIEPTRSFAPEGPPTSMRMLCSPVVTTHIYSLAQQAVQRIQPLLIPDAVASPQQARAIGVVLMDLAWRAAFEPVEAECEQMVIPMCPNPPFCPADHSKPDRCARAKRTAKRAWWFA